MGPGSLQEGARPFLVCGIPGGVRCGSWCSSAVGTATCRSSGGGRCAPSPTRASRSCWTGRSPSTRAWCRGTSPAGTGRTTSGSTWFRSRGARVRASCSPRAPAWTPRRARWRWRGARRCAMTSAASTWAPPSAGSTSPARASTRSRPDPSGASSPRSLSASRRCGCSAATPRRGWSWSARGLAGWSWRSRSRRGSRGKGPRGRSRSWTAATRRCAGRRRASSRASAGRSSGAPSGCVWGPAWSVSRRPP
jgi:hypothetical protein